MRERLFPRLLLATLAVAAAQVPAASAQQGKPAVEPPGAGPTPATAKAPGAARDGLIPELKVNNANFGDIIQYIREVDPSFQAVVSYQAEDGNGPKIQELNLKNVTAATVLQLLSQTYQGITVQAVETGEGTIYTIRVAAERGQGAGGGFGEGRPAKERRVTTVHRLREIVDEMSARDNGEGARKRTLAAVMSLVQAAVETADEGGEDRRPGAGEVRLNLHEGTETLVFKGSGTQAQLVQATLETLTPSRDDRVRAANDRVDEARRAMESTARELRASQTQQQQLKERAVELEKTVATLNAGMEQMRVRLGEWQKRYGAQAPPTPAPPGGPPAAPTPPPDAPATDTEKPAKQ